MIRQLRDVKCLAFLTLLIAAPAWGQTAEVPQENNISVAVLEAEIFADLSAETRKALSGTLDTLLTTSLKEKGFKLVDRQLLDEILAEKKAPLTGLSPINTGEVSAELRPFWSAGVLICPNVHRQNADPQQKRPSMLLISLDAVAAQTGQLLAELHISSEWDGTEEPEIPALDDQLPTFCEKIAQHVTRAKDLPLFEIVDVKLVSPLTRLQWMADDLTDTLRIAASANQQVLVLTPRHPGSTKEERLLRVMGLAAARQDDLAAGLQPTPDIRALIEFVEKPADGISFEKTPITVVLRWRTQNDQTTTKELLGTIGQYEGLRQDAIKWLDQQSRDENPPRKPDDEKQLAKQQSKEELAMARHFVEIYNTVHGPFGAGLEAHIQMTPLMDEIRTGIARHALRASHLDPTSEESAFLAAITIDSLYPAETVGKEGRSQACIQRVMAEGQRYIDRFGQPVVVNNNTYKVLTAMTAVGGGYYQYYDKWQPWTNTAVRAHAQTNAAMEAHLSGTGSSTWGLANQVANIFRNCPAEEVESQYEWWHRFWTEKIDSLKIDSLPRWEYASLGYYVRRRDVPGLRSALIKLGQFGPEACGRLWQELSGSPPDARVHLRNAGDEEWESWMPEIVVPSGVYYPTLKDWHKFYEEVSPQMPPFEDFSELPTFPADLTVFFPKDVFEYGTPHDSNQAAVQPLCLASHEIWFTAPGVMRSPFVPEHKNYRLYIANTADLEQRNGDILLSLAPIEWPEHPVYSKQDPANRPPFIVNCAFVDQSLAEERVWIGTQHHGLVCFWREDGTWKSHWYGEEAGIPGKSIHYIALCLHDGQKKLLLCVRINQERTISENEYVIALDPVANQTTLLLSTVGRKEFNGQQMAFVWPNGMRVPVRQYRSDRWPDLDLKDVKQVVPFAWDAWWPPGGGDVWLSGQDPQTKRPRIWRSGTDGIGELNAELTWTPHHLTSTTSIETIFYDGQTCFISAYPWSHGGGWQRRSTPTLGNSACPAGKENFVWGVSTAQVERIDRQVVMGYRMPIQGENDWAKNDLWFGPFKAPNGRDVIALTHGPKGKLLVTAKPGTMYVVSCNKLIETAENQHRAYSTVDWQQTYRKRIEKVGWTCIVSDQIADRKWEEALKTLDAVPADDRVLLYRALIVARMGKREAEAAQLYRDIVDSPTSAPTVRAFAMINRIKLLHLAGRWNEMLETADRFCKMFPSMKPSGNPTHALDWYRNDARSKLTAQKNAEQK